MMMMIMIKIMIIMMILIMIKVPSAVQGMAGQGRAGWLSTRPPASDDRGACAKNVVNM